MRAAIYNGQKNVLLTELETPIAGNNDIVVRNIYASICGTDVAVYQHGPNTGHRVTLGGEFGHEMVSEVVQIGKNVSGLHIGDRVYPYPRLAKGDPRRAGTVGGFSEYVLIPDAELGKQVYAVPEKIPSKTASLIEPFTVGCRAARRSFPRQEERAIVFGAGTIGIAAAIALKYFGCVQVMVCDLSDFRLEKARALGFMTCNSKKENLQRTAARYFGEAVSALGMTADVDIYIDAAGADGIIETYQSMGKVDSRMVVVAVKAGLRPIDVLAMTYGQHALIGSGGYMPEDVADVIAMMESGKWNIASIITHEYPWEELPQAIEKAGNVEEALNVVIRY